VKTQTKGMTVQESKLYLEKRMEETCFGYSWEQIAKMQRSGKLKLNPMKARAKGRPCVQCGKPSGSVGLLPQCKSCLKKAKVDIERESEECA
jgi:hypothetical protein